MWLVLVHAVAVWFMTGSIWTMQVLNYPLLARVGQTAFPGYEQAHNTRFVRVVGPGVAITAVATVGLMLFKPTELSWITPAIAVVLLAVIVISTILLQAPRMPASPGALTRPCTPAWCAATGSAPRRGQHSVSSTCGCSPTRDDRFKQIPYGTLLGSSGP